MKPSAAIIPIVLTMLAFSVAIVMAAEVTLVGEVNDNFQFYADGQLYEVARTPAGDDMVTNYISAKVEVVGTIEEKEGEKIITVLRFKVVPE